jgi:hypothetical protein
VIEGELPPLVWADVTQVEHFHCSLVGGLPSVVEKVPVPLLSIQPEHVAVAEPLVVEIEQIVAEDPY